MSSDDDKIEEKLHIMNQEYRGRLGFSRKLQFIATSARADFVFNLIYLAIGLTFT